MRFPSGQIASSQLAFTVARTFHRPDLWLDCTGRGAREQRMELFVQRWSHPEGLKGTGERRFSGKPGFLGAAWHLQGDGAVFLAGEGSAAASGTHAGYMDLMAGAGLQVPLDGGRHFFLRGTALAGIGGGGGLDLGGGFLVKGNVALAFRSGTQEWSLDGGMVRAPGNGFTARTWGVRTGRVFGAPGRGEDGDWRFTCGWQALSRTQRRVPGRIEPGIGLIQLGGVRHMGEHLYLSCHTGFAASGGAGAYATGALGLGVQTVPLASVHRFLAEVRLGAGGGAGLDTRGGGLVQPMAGWRSELGDGWGLQILAGHVRSLRGSLDSPVAEVALVFGGR